MTNDHKDPARLDEIIVPVSSGYIGRQHHEAVVRALIEQSRGPVVVHDGSRVVYANYAAKRLLGLSEKTEVAGTMLDFVPVPVTPSGHDAGQGGVQGDVNDIPNRVRIRTPDGRELTVLATHVPVDAASASAVATFIEGTDEITVPVSEGGQAGPHMSIRRGVEEAKNWRDREVAEAMALREQRRLALAIEASDAGVFEMGLDEAGTVEYTGAWNLILGVDPTELPSRTTDLKIWLVEHVHPNDWNVATQGLQRFLDGNQTRYAAEFRLKHQTGRWVDVAAFARVVSPGPGGRPLHVAGALRDISQRKGLEAQLRQAQKMEAVGQLAGGVAHDFNNLLTAILSFGEFALEAIPEGGPARPDIAEILKAADCAKSLTSQLLAFSRRRTVAPRVLSINDVVASAEKILRRLIGADVELRFHLTKDLWNVMVDHDELEQVLLNLAINARDAMPNGGKLTIETDNVLIEDGYGASHGTEVPPGDYVVVAVSDSGTGMDAPTQARIFEPFFTTKEVGHGTGLGLSTCYGIVKQANGFIWVYSEVGQGTTFRVYLPRAAGPADTVVPQPEPRDLRGTEAIMVVEDNDQVRQLATRALSRLGYSIVDAANGAEALHKCESLGHRIDLLVTDVVMPSFGGKELAARMRARFPSMRVLYLSGYAPSAITHQGILDTGASVLQKPFTPNMLTRRVRQALDDSGPASTQAPS